jgi:hypothetical protein
LNVPNRNFILIQENSPEEKFTIFNATKKNNGDSSSFNFNSNKKSIQLTKLQHVVAVFSLAAKNAVFYVDGSEQGAKSIPGDVASLSWSTERQITLGNSTGQTNATYAWEGDMHLVAIYCKALSEKEVQQNREAGADP